MFDWLVIYKMIENLNGETEHEEMKHYMIQSPAARIYAQQKALS